MTMSNSTDNTLCITSRAGDKLSRQLRIYSWRLKPSDVKTVAEVCGGSCSTNRHGPHLHLVLMLGHALTGMGIAVCLVVALC
jgi:hypothetical protein